MGTTNWLEKLLRRLPLAQPGTLVASQEGVGVFLGNLAGGNRLYGIMRDGKVFVDLYPTGIED
jgi:hypothetical protein